jgi:hypothetical protein
VCHARQSRVMSIVETGHHHRFIMSPSARDVRKLHSEKMGALRHLEAYENRA